MSLMRTEAKAKDVMTLDPVCVKPSYTIREFARTLEEHEISGAPVVDQQGRVIGIASKTDLIRQCVEGTGEIPPAFLFEVLAEQGQEEFSEAVPEPLISVDDFMTEDPLMVGPDTSAASIASLMFENRVHRVIVVDHDEFPVGVITSLDLLGVVARS